MKKKLLMLLMISLLLPTVAFLLVGCGRNGKNPAADGKLTVVATTFAGYDLARGIMGEAADVSLHILGKPGQDMHSYEPTPADITTLGDADLVIVVGSETWLSSTLRAVGNEAVTKVDMMAACGQAILAETDVHGHEGHDHAAGESCGLIGADEHVWLSPKNAVLITEAIGDALCAVDGDRRTDWEAGTAAYTAELNALWTDYTAMMEEAVRTTVVIADRYPFAYLFRDLGVTCHAAFPGCSSETSASFATQTKLIEAVKENGLPCVFQIDGSDGTVAHTVAESCGVEVLSLLSMQTVTDYKQTYITIMGANLVNLRKALC